jgi:hypothetical protein
MKKVTEMRKLVKEHEKEIEEKKKRDIEVEKANEAYRPTAAKNEYEEKWLLKLAEAAKAGNKECEIQTDYYEIVQLLRNDGFKVKCERRWEEGTESYTDYQGQAFRPSGEYSWVHYLTVSW